MKGNLNRDEKIELYLKGAKEFYPEISVSSALSIYSAKQEHPTSGNIQIKHGLVDPSLFSAGPLEILHYTSLQSFFEIINSESIRLYNSYNLNDPKEIEHGLKTLAFQYDINWLKDLKRNHFILSSSKYDNLIKDDFNLWRLYGNDGMGVGLVFEVPENIKTWVGVNLSSVEYLSDQSTSSISKKFLDYHMDFQSKYKLFENIPSIIPLLATFKKDEIWKIENETRIVAFCPYDKYKLDSRDSIFKCSSPYLSKTISHTINSKGDQVAFVSMPISQLGIQKKLNVNLDNDIKENIIKSHPYLQLKKVILGPRLINSKQIHPVVEFVQNIANNKIGESIEIIESKFKDIYKNDEIRLL
jgi:hypothetical protein